MTAASTSPTRIGLLGVGTVGSALAELVGERSDLHLAKALVRDRSKPRSVVLDEGVMTSDLDEVIDAADMVVEVMGGTGFAVDAMQAALDRGLPVVTANKAALAERWDAFLPAMRDGRLHFEAAVMAGVPVVGAVAGALRGSAPIELHAILNGTCSFILSRLEQGVGYDSALAEAQRLGYAEADPTLDVGGIDAAHKLAILARLAADPEMSWTRVAERTHGIERLTPGIVHEAMEDGGRVQLVASLVPGVDGWEPRVRPVYLPARHPLADLDDASGALLYRGVGGRVRILGPGAGGIETASGVLGDVLAAAAGQPGPRPLSAPLPPPRDVLTEDLGELEPA